MKDLFDFILIALVSNIELIVVSLVLIFASL